ncbi:glycosyltransferase family 4 protein [Cellulomonas dongxiuzhuiae]|uniref:Glycosyltransferase family 4 protein n=1 Tax=Cellulomonas dongxiuzhuiae TaxID=2819979 RepID=A0ABX8GMY7_9CELL|nr:glycosyltransferase family 4 protein [Cellulomonas dongxiuzhuiae]MBO3096485.1 glycosyltransferase family 4 protein [Cellulomonas dongxiuzhuiae]QWC16881.1 glycosyltransferase family 4 protein [Cellulomonas dongxiuzhuiae]
MTVDAPGRARAPLRAHVQLYEQARTAHLERQAADPRLSLLYAAPRYDFDVQLAERLDARRASTLDAARLLWRSDVAVLEITEPAFLAGIVRAATCLTALRLRRVVRRRPLPRVVSYAIGNNDPREEYQPRSVREQVTFRAKWWMSSRVVRRVDRLVFGTPQAAATYHALYGPPSRHQETRTIPALPTPCSCPTAAPDPGRILFLGAFVERKGLAVLLEAWPALAEHPGTTLTCVGKGQLEGEVRALAATDDRVRVVVDPPREQIHAELRAASVLVLPSQASPTWREQVGLPIVEALEHGCTVVTTDQTGLAPWLAEHGHRVVPSSAAAADLGDALLDTLLAPLPRAEVLASLPTQDGREAAHAWMFADSDSGRG